MPDDWAAPTVGGIECDLIRHFFDSLSREARLNLHVLLHYGSNTHHQVEAAFKAFARALDDATQRDPRLGDRPADDRICRNLFAVHHGDRARRRQQQA